MVKWLGTFFVSFCMAVVTTTVIGIGLLMLLGSVVNADAAPFDRAQQPNPLDVIQGEYRRAEIQKEVDNQGPPPLQYLGKDKGDTVYVVQPVVSQQVLEAARQAEATAAAVKMMMDIMDMKIKSLQVKVELLEMKHGK